MEAEREFNAPELVKTYGVRDLKAEYIVQGYRAVIDPAQIPKWEDAASAIEVTSEEQREDMAMARELRLKIRNTRTTVESTRKELKEDALRESKAIDGLGGAIRKRLEAVEGYLKEQEEYAKRQAEERERNRREEADRLLREKEEREAQEREAARRAEEKRMREENAKLRKEAEEREAAIEAERQLHAEAQARKDAERNAAEEKARKEREAEARKIAEERERERREAAAALRKAQEEADRLAASVVCPQCGAEFDARGRHPEDVRA